MSNEVDELSVIKNNLEQKKTILSRLEGQSESLDNQLKEMGFSSYEEASEKREVLAARRDHLQEQFQKKLQDFKDAYPMLVS